ncbi:cation-translocating P-type ATPase [Yinghuangia seranimata]|uniref:cation-translocating P-type ATPase n=1 Tax=Yinghuangia seranimata TaxID=408067 RepID=UPI00248B5975|nr:cation-translocating P-type ATPase [Yinghuangia seranimata]MDI2131243.1 cation-translocating P-type ATPase [Yinghuangia seranimata]
MTDAGTPPPAEPLAGAPAGAALSPRGLTTAEVAERVARGAVNDVPARSSRSAVEIVRGNVFTRFNAIIGTLFVIIMVFGEPQDGLFGLVIVANTGIGIVQELRAKKTLDALAVVGEAKPRVRRDGHTVELTPRELVLDDVCELGSGEQVVVDGVVVEAQGLELDESLLTGESDPTHKKPGDPVMSGSFVAAGNGAFRATKVGADAYAAKLAEEASRFTLTKSELRSGLDTILKYVTWLMVPVGILLLISQLESNAGDFGGAMTGMVAGVVTMVPEGLMLLTSVAFAVGVVRLGRKQCLVQELPAIEGLARVDVVCLDKTGTLTEGGMDVGEIRTLDDSVPVKEVLGAFGASDPHPNASLQAIVDACPAPDDDRWRVTGTEPFSSARKWSGASFAGEGSWFLGAPDVLLPEGDPVLGEVDELGAQGLRVLLLAKAPDGLTEQGASEARPAALVVLQQRLRPDAADTLRYFAGQDVAAKVISGDNALSVGAVAGTLGLPGADHPVDARTLPEDRAELAERLDANTVFGRVTPQQKRAMVAALQSKGHTVAMTGDGVNDVLALKDADIGVAMGSGSAASRAVAQIVLLDNRFSTLPSVVAEGRRVIGNIERVANLFLSKTVYSLLLSLLIGVVSLPFPFLPRHLTLIGTLTIGTPAFFLALAPNNERARPGFVQRVLRFAVPSGIVAAGATFLTYWFARLNPTSNLDQDRTAATITLFMVAMWILAIVARPYTLWKIALIAAMGCGYLLALFVPFLSTFFALYPQNLPNWGIAVAMGLAGMAVLEVGWHVSGWIVKARSAKAA